MQQTLINTLADAIRALLPVACDGIEARDRDATDDDDRALAEDAQAAIEHARQLLREPALLGACALEHAQRLHAIRTTNAGNCAGSWAESVQLREDIIEAAKAIERQRILQDATPIRAMIDPVLSRFVANGMAAQAAVDAQIGKAREEPAPYDTADPCTYCGALAGEPCAPDCLPAFEYHAPPDEPWATPEGLAARQAQKAWSTLIATTCTVWVFTAIAILWLAVTA
jgi:hypothetical protein